MMNKEQFRKLVQERFIFSDGNLRPEWLLEDNGSFWRNVKSAKLKKGKYLTESNIVYIIYGGNPHFKIIYSTPEETYIFYLPEERTVSLDGWSLQKEQPRGGFKRVIGSNLFQYRKVPISFQNDGKGWYVSPASSQEVFVLSDYHTTPKFINWMNENPFEIK